MSSNIVGIDYETEYKKGEYSVRDLGNWRYCHDPRFNPYLVTVADETQSWAGHPRDFNWDALEDCELVAHNAAFERAVTGALIEQGRVPVRLLQNKWHCTANMMSCLFGVRSLEDSIFVTRGEKLSKSIRDNMSGKRWADLSEKERGDLAHYGMKDTHECRGLYIKYGHLWSPFEQQLSELTMKQCSRGVFIDKKRLEKYRAILQEVIFNLVKSFPWTEKGAKPTSPIAIAEQCRAVGIPAPPVKTKDEEGFNEWETTYGPKYTWVYGAGQWRKLNKLLSTLETIRERIRPDGTIDFSLLYFGGHTGRWSGGGAGLNMQNLRKEPLYVKNGCMVGSKEGADMDLDIRALFMPRPGRKFIICDLSQIEPRVINWLAGNTEILDAIRDGYAYYQAYAKLYKKNDYPNWSRQPMDGKAFQEAIGGNKVYTKLKNESIGLTYQMGAERYTDYANVEESEAEAVVATFRENNPKLVALWNKLDLNFKRSVGTDFTVELPSGRTMTYRDVRPQVRLKLNKKTGKMEKRTVWTALIGRDRYELYGGLIAENITQATARDVIGVHMLEIEENKGDVIFHAHDETITEVDQDVSAKEIEEIMSKAPEWLPGCPVAAEAKEAPHYLK